jgi:hypothetical protein
MEGDPAVQRQIKRMNSTPNRFRTAFQLELCVLMQTECRSPYEALMESIISALRGFEKLNHMESVAGKAEVTNLSQSKGAR